MKNKTKRVIRYRGLVAAARELGVCRNHLWFVLKGERRSPRIEASEFYQRMVKGQAHGE